MTSIDRLYRVIQEPLLTEKGNDDRMRRNAYHFRVPVAANKVEIRQAVEKLFKVKVLRVNTLRAPPRLLDRRHTRVEEGHGRAQGRRHHRSSLSELR